MNVYILLDRSSSMSGRMNGALKTLNEYVRSLPKATKVTLASFDYQDPSYFNLNAEGAGMKFDVVRNGPAKAFADVTYAEVAPRGGTPLFDAIGKITDMIAADKSKLGTLMILTDGEENQSKTVNQDGARVRLDAVRTRGWDVVQIGVEFDAYQQAASVGTQAQFVGNATMGSLNNGMAANALRSRTMAYGVSGQSVGFSDDEKTALAG